VLARLAPHVSGLSSAAGVYRTGQPALGQRQHLFDASAALALEDAQQSPLVNGRQMASVWGGRRSCLALHRACARRVGEVLAQYRECAGDRRVTRVNLICGGAAWPERASGHRGGACRARRSAQAAGRAAAGRVARGSPGWSGTCCRWRAQSYNPDGEQVAPTVPDPGRRDPVEVGVGSDFAMSFGGGAPAWRIPCTSHTPPLRADARRHGAQRPSSPTRRRSGSGARRIWA